MVVYAFGQWFSGRVVLMAGVDVAPEARGWGIGGRLLTASFAAMGDRGEALSALYPTVAAVYRSAGAEFAGRYEQTMVDIASVHEAVRRWAVRAREDRPVLTAIARGGDELLKLRPLYDRAAAAFNCWLERRDVFWARLAYDYNPSCHNRFCYRLTDDTGELRGGLTIAHRRASATGLFDVEVGGAYVDDPYAMVAELELVASLGPTANRAVFNLPVEHLGPVLSGAPVRQAVSQQWMLRIVDLAGAMTDRGYNPAVETEIGFSVADAQAPWINGAWTVAVSNGAATLAKVSDDPTPRPDRPHLPIGNLSAIYSGYLNPVELERTGGLSGADRSTASRLAAVFAGPPPRVIDHF